MNSSNKSFSLEPLPYTYDHLEPWISERTVRYHYLKHLQGYLDSLKGENRSLEEIVRESTPGSKLYQNASQAYNHYLYFRQLNPVGIHHPLSRMEELVKKCFGSLSVLKFSLLQVGMDVFGSGWVFLTLDDCEVLHIREYTGTGTPIIETPLIALDVWEHAYYLDYQNNRKLYIEKFFEILDWRTIENRLYERNSNNYL